MVNIMENDTIEQAEIQQETQSENNPKQETKKNAFKIFFEKGVKLTTSIKTTIKDELGCHFSPTHQAYVCPRTKNKCSFSRHCRYSFK
jgi:hypothetical protein